MEIKSFVYMQVYLCEKKNSLELNMSLTRINHLCSHAFLCELFNFSLRNERSLAINGSLQLK